MAFRDQLAPDFIEDVERRLQEEGTDDVNVLIGKLQHRYSIIQSAEHTVLQQRHRYQSKETYLKDTLACVRLMLQRKQEGQDTIVDYSLSGMFAENLECLQCAYELQHPLVESCSTIELPCLMLSCLFPW
jgi:hypothetical protein